MCSPQELILGLTSNDTCEFRTAGFQTVVPVRTWRRVTWITHLSWWLHCCRDCRLFRTHSLATFFFNSKSYPTATLKLYQLLKHREILLCCVGHRPQIPWMLRKREVGTWAGTVCNNWTCSNQFPLFAVNYCMTVACLWFFQFGTWKFQAYFQKSVGFQFQQKIFQDKCGSCSGETMVFHMVLFENGIP